jgi:tyrosine aminotransferase
MMSSRPVEMISIENDDDDSIDDGWHWHEQVCMSAFKLRSESESETLATNSITSSTVSSPSLHPLSAPNGVDVVPGLDDLQLLNDDSTPASSSRSSSTSPGVIAMAPASRKSLRTHNPIRAIVDPIMAHSIKCGKERGDGKDQISLAVSIHLCSFISSFLITCCV